MRKPLLLTLMVALLLGAACWSPARADAAGDLKPLAVASFAGYGELLDDLALVGKLADRPEVPQMFEAVLTLATQGHGLAGLDKERPWGAVILPADERPVGFAFLPITDLDQLHEVVKPHLREVTDVGGEVYKLEGKRGDKPLYVKEQNGWLLASDNADVLSKAPDNPSALLEGLDGQYDVAVRLYVCNVPAEDREKLLAKLKRDAKKELERRSGESDEELAARKILAKAVLKAVSGAANELQQITLGWSLDNQDEVAGVELSVTALEGTSAAADLAGLTKAKTRFAGFCIPGAALSWSLAANYDLGGGEELGAVFKAIRDAAFREIDLKHMPEEAAAVKQLADGLLQATRETLASGRADGAASVVLKPDALTVAVGKYVADAAALEETLGDFVEAVRRKHPDFVNNVLTIDAGEHKGVRFHTLSLPLPGQVKNRAQVVQLVGEKLDVVVGIGQQSFYWAAGKNAMATLKEAIDRSQSAAAETSLPMEISLALSPVAQFVAQAGPPREREKAQKAAELLETVDGKDHIRLTASPIERGVKYRLEAEQGVLKLIGAATRKQ
ncbi:MAG: hypothetical protein JXB62_12590 [Pirellulales bacterium]|nr:hypothetical protein [Pirellulales bacterium]